LAEFVACLGWMLDLVATFVERFWARVAIFSFAEFGVSVPATETFDLVLAEVEVVFFGTLEALAMLETEVRNSG
jgi:hypothetical protein